MESRKKRFENPKGDDTRGPCLCMIFVSGSGKCGWAPRRRAWMSLYLSARYKPLTENSSTAHQFAR